MTEQDWQRAKEAIALALEGDAAERAAILAAQLHGHPELLSEAEQLLSAYDGSPLQHWLETVAIPVPRPTMPAVSAPPPGSNATTGLSEQFSHAEVWGDFVLLEELGRGGFGTVYRAHERALKREVALKIIDTSRSAAQSNSIRLEGQMLARIDHPNVVRVHGIHRHGDRLAIAMEYVRGHTLAHLVSAHGPFTPRDAAVAAATVCGALIAVHRGGLLHRDVKASNVMRTRTGRIVLMDFGAGRDLYRPPDPDSEEIGTPIYMAPEVLAGGRASTASDVFSLGVLLFFLLTGRYPQAPTVGAPEGGEAHAWDGEALRGVPGGLATLVGRMLDADPARRPLMDAGLKRALNGALPRTIRPDGSDPGASQPQPRNEPAATGATTAGLTRPAPAIAPSAVNWRRALALAGLSALAVFAMGILSTAEYNQVLGRRGGFAIEAYSAYLIVGLKSLFLPAALMLMAVVVTAIVTFLWRIAGAVAARPTQGLCRVFDRMRIGLDRRGLLTRTAVQQAACVLGLMAFVLILSSYAGFVAALTTSVDDGPAEVFGALNSGLREQKGHFRTLMIMVMLGLIASLAATRRLPRDDSSTLAAGSVIAMTALIGIVVAGSWRVMYAREFREVLYGSAPCYVLGEYQREWLLHCPRRSVPRNQVVPMGDPRLTFTGNVGSPFDAYPLVPGYVPTPGP